MPRRSSPAGVVAERSSIARTIPCFIAFWLCCRPSTAFLASTKARSASLTEKWRVDQVQKEKMAKCNMARLDPELAQPHIPILNRQVSLLPHSGRVMEGCGQHAWRCRGGTCRAVRSDRTGHQPLVVGIAA